MGINDLCEELTEQRRLVLVEDKTICTLLEWTFEQVTVVSENNFYQASGHKALRGTGMPGAASAIRQGRYPQLPVHIGSSGATDTMDQDQP